MTPVSSRRSPVVLAAAMPAQDPRGGPQRAPAGVGATALSLAGRHAPRPSRSPARPGEPMPVGLQGAARPPGSDLPVGGQLSDLLYRTGLRATEVHAALH